MPQRNGIGSHSLPNNGATNTWITPKEIIHKLGTFDLDPCAAKNQPWPCANHQFTEDDDGLSKDWFGLVYMNPPYGKNTGIWLEKLADHNNGIALIFARTETKMFFDHVWNRASSLLFIEGRLWFYDESGTRGKSNSGAPSVLIGYGKEADMRLKNSGIRGSYINSWILNSE